MADVAIGARCQEQIPKHGSKSILTSSRDLETKSGICALVFVVAKDIDVVVQRSSSHTYYHLPCATYKSLMTNRRSKTLILLQHRAFLVTTSNVDDNCIDDRVVLQVGKRMVIV